MSKSITGLAESLFTNAKEYLNNRLDLVKLKIADNIANLLSAIVSGIILFILFIFFFIIFSIGLGFFIGHLTGHIYIGFLIVAAFYFLLGLFVFMSRKTIIKSLISGIVIKKMFKKC